MHDLLRPDKVPWGHFHHHEYPPAQIQCPLFSRRRWSAWHLVWYGKGISASQWYISSMVDLRSVYTPYLFTAQTHSTRCATCPGILCSSTMARTVPIIFDIWKTYAERTGNVMPSIAWEIYKRRSAAQASQVFFPRYGTWRTGKGQAPVDSLNRAFSVGIRHVGKML